MDEKKYMVELSGYEMNLLWDAIGMLINKLKEMNIL